ncbi:hypothetical protein DENIS_2298 [Desulfonema ishimotonii]|uniref:Bacterial repeat domain-containing protein n=1 Tax=Desulfonema ishimotonii TaxID=45657 RepID=A0A401FWJ1_9BACT|nr:hypothetical protein [Desulfonema ishimotonii]GBC61338.1 hypothetical protein DENIS_2298 [Desulfonema ishimotonii]
MTSGEYFTVRYESGGVKLVVSEVISEFSIGLTISPSGSGRVLIEEEGDGETGTTGLTFTCPDDCVDSDTECNSGFCKKYFAPGARLKLTATPGSGYLFDTWDGEVESTSDPKIVYVDMAADQSVTARFEISQPLPDRDGDGTPDTQDGCPDDPRKTSPGACGCGVADTDSDGDETPDCNDECPADPNKTAPGQCGCGVADTDSDGDETPDCNDECPDDPDKTSPGACGCGVADTDSDGDATPDCNDRCPDDPDKTEPGQCGCGLSDADSDGDGFSDCRDQCPDDPGKTLPGQCGCGVADTDTDGDGTADCNDKCPDDPNKTFPGQCGCGVVDTDSDGDGTPDCFDKCPNDADKTEPGQCGCGVADADSDGDGTPDCSDKCPNDPDKTEPGQCGCGIADTDSDGDGVADCESEAVSGIPVPISPENGETVAEDSVTLVAQVDLGSTVDGPMEIYWWWRPVDKKCTVSSETTEAYRGLAELRISGLRDGLQYAWQVGVRNPASGEIFISDEVFFTVGASEVEVPFRVDAGTTLNDYRMYSFSLWPEDADAADLLGDAVGEYDTKFFKIGTYDPEQSRYVEYDSGAITIVPGQAYWFLARNGLEASIRGIKVSVAENIHVHLRYDETREKGWNMIAPPNDGDYFRKDIQVIAYTEKPDGSFEAEPGFETPVPLSALEADNPWLDLVLWKWEGGRYVSMTPDDAAAVLLRNRGYWVNARRGNICLVFPGSARKDLPESEDTLATMMRRGGEWMGRHLTPDAAVADSGETPPMPIGYSGSGASGTGGGVDSGGGDVLLTR